MAEVTILIWFTIFFVIKIEKYGIKHKFLTSREPKLWLTFERIVWFIIREEAGTDQDNVVHLKNNLYIFKFNSIQQENANNIFEFENQNIFKF